MKRISVTLLILFSASFSVIGQQYSIGFKPSVNIVGAKFIETYFYGIELDSKISFSLGLTGEVKINKALSFQVEPRFISKGYNISNGDVNDKINNGYFSLPILLKIEPIHNFNLEFGPEASFLIYSNCIENQPGCFDNYKTGIPKPLELTIVAGLGYTFFERFDIGIRYGYGLTKYEEGKLITPDQMDIYYKIYNRYIEIFLNTIVLKFK